MTKGGEMFSETKKSLKKKRWWSAACVRIYTMHKILEDINSQMWYCKLFIVFLIVKVSIEDFLEGVKSVQQANKYNDSI
jgi:hypothetical protein